MKRDRPTKTKLNLNRETIRELGRKELHGVQGGDSTDLCTTTLHVNQVPKQ